MPNVTIVADECFPVYSVYLLPRLPGDGTVVNIPDLNLQDYLAVTEAFWDWQKRLAELARNNSPENTEREI